MADTAQPYTSFQRRLDAFIHGSERVHHGDVGAVHRTRVASRRLRELLPLLELERSTTQRLRRRLRRVTKRLGTVRELDVLGLLISELARDARYSPASKLVGVEIASARAVARARLAVKLPLEELENLAAGLQRSGKHLESSHEKRHGRNIRRPRQAWRWALEARIKRRAANARTAIDAVPVVYLPERLHDVRIALKKLRYGVELLAEVRYPRAMADAIVLRTAQDLLGRLHDLEALIARTRHLQASLSPPDLSVWRQLGSLVHALEDDCRRLHARYMRDRASLIGTVERWSGTRPAAALISRRVAG